MKNKNLIFTVVAVFIFILLTVLALRCARQLYQYYSLTESVSVQIKNWDIKELKKNKYILMAHFIYNYKDREYEAHKSVGAIYPNPWAAREGIKRMAKKEFSCWLSPKNIENPVLTKKFPLKEVMKSSILAAILLYFCGLTFYYKKAVGG